MRKRQKKKNITKKTYWFDFGGEPFLLSGSDYWKLINAKTIVIEDEDPPQFKFTWKHAPFWYKEYKDIIF